jgi:hypothetical protein
MVVVVTSSNCRPRDAIVAHPPAAPGRTHRKVVWTAGSGRREEGHECRNFLTFDRQQAQGQCRQHMTHDGTPTSNQHIEASQRTRTRPTMKTGVCAV